MPLRSGDRALLPAQPRERAPDDSRRILLADDVELFLKLEATFFNRNEFDLMTARSGNEALRIIQEAEPELVFMDLYMPDMDGDECCRLVKADQRFRHVPIIMVTAVKPQVVTAVMRPVWVSEPDVIVKVLPVIVRVASTGAPLSCLALPV